MLNAIKNFKKDQSLLGYCSSICCLHLPKKIMKALGGLLTLEVVLVVSNVWDSEGVSSSLLLDWTGSWIGSWKYVLFGNWKLYNSKPLTVGSLSVLDSQRNESKGFVSQFCEKQKQLLT